jgi:hypothetical protein
MSNHGRQEHEQSGRDDYAATIGSHFHRRIYSKEPYLRASILSLFRRALRVS